MCTGRLFIEFFARREAILQECEKERLVIIGVEERCTLNRANPDMEVAAVVQECAVEKTLHTSDYRPAILY